MLVLPLLAATLLLPLACAGTQPAKRLLAELDLIGHPTNHTLPSPFSQVFEGYEHSDCGSRRVKERDALEELLGPALALVNRLDDSGLLCKLRKGPLQHLLEGKGALGRGIKAPLSPSDDHHLHARSTASERPLADRIKLVDVDVHWHIVHNSTTGRVPHSTIAAQMHILNTLCVYALSSGGTGPMLTAERLCRSQRRTCTAPHCPLYPVQGQRLFIPLDHRAQPGS